MTGILISVLTHFRRHAFSFGIACAVSACSSPDDPVKFGRISNIDWSDGDSGYIDGVRFRLADVDAPETSNVDNTNGALCALEQQRGFDAKSYIQKLTRGGKVEVVEIRGEDRYGRVVLSLSVNGLDLSDLGIASGHLKVWPHFNGVAESAKPDWCN